MCGIVGYAVAPGGRPPADFAAGVRVLAHRGPDGQGVYVDDAFALGHTRLAILDLSETGAQPMRSADGRYVIVFNGEIYNFRDLRRELDQRGVSLRGSSDTEVLLESYRIFGPAVLERLNGIFAFAIVDCETRELLLVRDPIGVKPLYVTEGPFGLAFASEIKAVLAIAPVDRTIDTLAVQRYLTFLWSPGERTILKAVRKVDPGTALLVKDGRVVRSCRYWRPPPSAPQLTGDWRAGAEELARQIEVAVERQMVSDAPLGSFLSGGLDSSSVVAAARRVNPDLHCFTMAVDGSTFGEMVDDLSYARLAAKSFGVKLTEVEIRPQDVIEGATRMVWDLDEPLADPACLNLRLISLKARDAGIKVLLSGTGGDDIMSGYRRHIAAAMSTVWDRVPLPMLTVLAGAARHGYLTRLGLRRMGKLLGGIDLAPEMRMANLFAWTPPEVTARLLDRRHGEPAAAKLLFEPLLDVIESMPDAPPLEQCLRLDLRFFLGDHNLIYTDKMGMSAGVEIRTPLLDLELVAFAARIPPEWKLRRMSPKWLFTQSQKGRVPDPILKRPKTGFGVPLRHWMKGPLRGMCSDLLSREVLSRRGLFDPDAVARLQQDNTAGRIDGSYALFSIMCIELWARSFVDEAPKVCK